MKNTEFKHELGKVAKDQITGFQGIITGRAQYLTGCNTYGLLPQKLNKEGKIQEADWFDEVRIKIVKDGPLHSNNESRDTGGPVDIPKRTY